MVARHGKSWKLISAEAEFNGRTPGSLMMKYREMQAGMQAGGLVEQNQNQVQENNNNEQGLGEQNREEENNKNSEDQEGNNKEQDQNLQVVFDLNQSPEHEQSHGDGDGNVEGDREVQEAKDLLYEGVMAVLKVLFRNEMRGAINEELNRRGL